MKTPLRRALVLTAALTSFSQAQTFTLGDLYLHTPAATGIGSGDGGLRHIDPTTSLNTLLIDFDKTNSAPGGAVYDAYRKRVLFGAEIGGLFQLWQADAAGSVEPIGFFDRKLAMMCETGDGRVYMNIDEPGYPFVAPFAWIDQANRRHTLLDSTGTQPFVFVVVDNFFPWRTMIYDPITNALFITARGTQGPCSVPGFVATIFKLPLSADGSRVVGPVTCNEYDVDDGGFEDAMDWGRLPSGELVMVIDTNSSASQSRLLKVDPVSLAITPYASISLAAVSGGTYSSVLDRMVVLDSVNDRLVTFAPGQTGTGTVLPISPPPSPSGSSGETTTLLEVTTNDCDGAFVPFGVGLAGTGGHVPALFASGCADVGVSMTLNIRDAVGGASGALFVSLGEGLVSFKGGEFYPIPTLLTIPFGVGGVLGTPAAGDLDLPAGIPADPFLAGTTIVLQAAFADSAAPANVSLTQGLRLEIE